MDIINIGKELFDLDVRILGTEEAPLFVADDVGKMLGLKNTRSSVSKYSSKYKISDTVQYNNNKSYNRIMALLTEKGVNKLLCSARTVNATSIKEVLNHKLEFMPSHKEIEFIYNVKKAFPNEIFELQKAVLDYRIDAYMPKYNIAIEYDENAHKYQVEDDIERQQYIERELSCRFIRIPESMNIFDAIGLIYKNIHP